MRSRACLDAQEIAGLTTIRVGLALTLQPAAAR